MNNNLTLSVVIPFYNVEEYLRECLESILNQTLKNIEIILVNDCSKDNRIKYIEHDKNKGMGGGEIQVYKKP